MGRERTYATVVVSVGSSEPRAEKPFDVAAALRVREPGLGTLVGDDDQGWDRLDPEPIDEIGLLVGVDVKDPEGLVVRAPLEYLRDESFDPSTASGGRRVEEEEARLSVELFGRLRIRRRHRVAARLSGSATSSENASWRVA